MPNLLPQLSIRLRLLLASTAVQVVLLSLLLFNSVRLMDGATNASLKAVIEQNAIMLHTVATAYGERGDYSVLQDTLGELLSEAGEGLVYVRIVSAERQLLLSAGMPDLLTLPPPDPVDESGLTEALNRNVIHVRRPLLLPGNEVGFLQFGVSASVLGAARQDILRQGALIAASEIFLTFFLLSGIGYFLTRNLAALLKGSRASYQFREFYQLWRSEGGPWAEVIDWADEDPRTSAPRWRIRLRISAENSYSVFSQRPSTVCS